MRVQASEFTTANEAIVIKLNPDQVAAGLKSKIKKGTEVYAMCKEALMSNGRAISKDFLEKFKSELIKLGVNEQDIETLDDAKKIMWALMKKALFF